MKTLAAIVEGYGDWDAVPHLVYRIGAYYDKHVIAPKPIRVGEWKKLRREGELERALELAISRRPDQIIVILDLDDGCPVVESTSALQRAAAWKNGRNVEVSVVFLTREYESLFLSCAQVHCDDAAQCADVIARAETIRDAKGALRSLLGRRYKETQDQAEMTKKLDIQSLMDNSRCGRKLIKEILR